MIEDIKAIIHRALDSQEALLPNRIDRSKGDDTPLFGQDGQLDSMALVSLIVAVEEAVEVRFRIRLILASERAMSARHSPFATVGTLAAYVDTLMKETAHA